MIIEWQPGKYATHNTQISINGGAGQAWSVKRLPSPIDIIKFDLFIKKKQQHNLFIKKTQEVDLFITKKQPSKLEL